MNHPLILVFYLDRETMMNSELVNVFAESVNEGIAARGANIMAYFLPTDGEERIECINPETVKPAEMERVNRLVDEIAKQFDIKQEALAKDQNDYLFLSSEDCSWKLEWDYLMWNDENEKMKSSSYEQKDWNQTLITRVNQISAQISKASLRGGANNIRIHSCLNQFLILCYITMKMKMVIIF